MSHSVRIQISFLIVIIRRTSFCHSARGGGFASTISHNIRFCQLRKWTPFAALSRLVLAQGRRLQRYKQRLQNSSMYRSNSPFNCLSRNNFLHFIIFEIDECNRLWVLDAGSYEDFSTPCPPQLLVFDLNLDHLIERVRIPNEIAGDQDNNTLLSNVVVETKGLFCEDTTVIKYSVFVI